GDERVKRHEASRTSQLTFGWSARIGQGPAIRPDPVRPRRVSWNAMRPRFQCVLAHWIRGFIAFPKGRPAPSVTVRDPVTVRGGEGASEHVLQATAAPGFAPVHVYGHRAGPRRWRHRTMRR